jgi:hypothetical protein
MERACPQGTTGFPCRREQRHPGQLPLPPVAGLAPGIPSVCVISKQYIAEVGLRLDAEESIDRYTFSLAAVRPLER